MYDLKHTKVITQVDQVRAMTYVYGGVHVSDWGVILRRTAFTLNVETRLVRVIFEHVFRSLEMQFDIKIVTILCLIRDNRQVLQDWNHASPTDISLAEDSDWVPIT